MSRYQTSNVGQDTRLLRDDELEVVSGGIMIIGGTQTLGGPDTSPLRYVGDTFLPAVQR
jgi:hypothetical protein